MKLPVIGIIIALLTTTLASAPILLQQQSSGAVTGGSLNPATRYCVVGTGAGTNRACIPCDIGLGAGNCRDTLTGWTPCPRYGPIPLNCTLNPFNQVPGTTVTPAPGVLDPTLGAAGGGVAQQPTPTTPTLPPLFGRNTANVPLGGGVLGQPTITAATPTPIPTPPQFGQIAPQGQVLPPTGDEGLTGVAPRIVEPPPICTPGSVLDPNINECVLENPPQLCPDGSIPKSTGPGGTRPECPPFETEEPEVEDPDQPETQQPETQQPQDNEEVGPPNEGQDTTAGSLT